MGLLGGTLAVGVGRGGAVNGAFSLLDVSHGVAGGYPIPPLPGVGGGFGMGGLGVELGVGVGRGVAWLQPA